MFFNSRRNAYDAGEGPVRYLNGSSLARPLDMPKPQIAIMVCFVIAAAVIGGVLLFNVLDQVNNSAARAQVSVEQNLARPSSMESLPSLAALINLDDETIKAQLTEAGFTIYDATKTEGDGAGQLDLIKLPADVPTAEAALLYAQGIPSLSAADAVRLLNGSWNLTANRGDFTDMRVKYADFASGSVEAAIQAAIAAEGFDPATFGDAGVDEAGNTYQAGVIDVNGQLCNWKVSAISLSSVYNVKGLPDTAVYVGVRLYPQA